MLDAKETLELISKPWCTLNDLMKLAGVGRNKALDIKRTIAKDLLEKGYCIPKATIPMQAAVEYLHIDIDYLEMMTNINQKIKENH